AGGWGAAAGGRGDSAVRASGPSAQAGSAVAAPGAPDAGQRSLGAVGVGPGPAPQGARAGQVEAVGGGGTVRIAPEKADLADHPGAAQHPGQRAQSRVAQVEVLGEQLAPGLPDPGGSEQRVAPLAGP